MISNASQRQLRGGTHGEQVLEEYFLSSVMPLQQTFELTKICAYNCI
jgi:hypothetical protein